MLAKTLVKICITTIVFFPERILIQGNVPNETLYNEIIDYFFPYYLQNPAMRLDDYLCYSEDSYKCCDCESKCSYYGTCCIDVFLSNKTKSLEEYLALFRKNNKVRQYVKSTPVLNIDAPFDISNITMVVTCGNNKSNYYTSCNKNFSASTIPVRANGVIYRSVACALCHDITNYSYVSYSLVSCRTKKNGLVVIDSDCMLNIIKIPYKPVITHTPRGINCSQAEMMMCQNSYYALVFSSKEDASYVNPFCAKCDGIESLNNFECYKTFHHQKTSSGPPTFQILISFNDFGDSQSNQIYGEAVCFCGYYFDIFSGHCMKSAVSQKCGNIPELLVPPPAPSISTNLPGLYNIISTSPLPPPEPVLPSLPSTGLPSPPPRPPSLPSKSPSMQPPLPAPTQFRSPEPSPRSEKLKPPLSLLSLNSSEDAQAPPPPHILRLTISQKLHMIYYCIKRNSGSLIYEVSDKKKLLLPRSDIIGSFIADKNYTMATLPNDLNESINNKNGISSISIILFKQLPYSSLYGFSPERYFENQRVCANFKNLSNNFQITSECSIKVGATVYEKDVTFWIKINNGQVSYNGAVCTQFHLLPTCPIGVLNMSFIKIENKWVITKIMGEEKRYSPEQYLPLPEGIGICMTNMRKKFTGYLKLKDYWLIEEKISFSFLSLSISLEIVTFMINCLLKEFDNIPGKNLTGLCISIFACDIMVLIIALAKHLLQTYCMIIAVLLHYFSLAICTWTVVITYDISIVLKRPLSIKGRKNPYLKYSVFGWGLPLLIISISVCIDLFGNKTFSFQVGYGKFNHCWISYFYARLAFYIVPFSLMTFGSFLAICDVIFKLKKETKTNMAIAGRKYELNLAKMTIRLCLILGVSELIGLVQIPDNKVISKQHEIFNVIFGSLYNLSRSLRGCFIFIVLLYGKQVRIKCKDSLNKSCFRKKIKSTRKYENTAI